MSLLQPYTQPFRSEYMSVINRAVSRGFRVPSPGVQYSGNQFMRTIVNGGIYSKLDVIYALNNDGGDSSDGLNFARVNWKNPLQYELIDEGTEPILYLNRCGPYANTEVSGVGGLNTQWAPSTGPNFTQNSNTVVHAYLSGYGATGVTYRADSGLVIPTLNYNLDGFRQFYNNSGLLGSSINGGVGNNFVWFIRRTASNAGTIHYYDPVSGTLSLSDTFTTPTAGISSDSMRLLAYTASADPKVSANSPLNFFAAGGLLTDAECIALGAAIHAYNDAQILTKQFVGSTSGNYTVPAGVTQLFVECWGAGAAGRGYPNVAATTTGAGGGGGAYSAKLCTVTPASSIPYSVGGGGTGNTGAGAAGGDTSWNSGEVLAKGGGVTPSETVGGTGGQASAGTGTTKYDGGNGGAGGAALTYNTGSGGSAGGPTGNGIAGVAAINAGGNVRGAYNMFTGTPGFCVSSASNSAGIPGMYGSGGSGARRTSSTRNGGNGGNGVIRISIAKTLNVH